MILMMVKGWSHRAKMRDYAVHYAALRGSWEMSLPCVDRI